MKVNFNKLFACSALAGVILVFASCNKDVEDPTPITPKAATTSKTINDTLNGDTDLSLLKAAVARASASTNTPSLTALLTDPTARFTVFAPNDAAFKQLFNALAGIPLNAPNATFIGAINAQRPGFLDTVIRYHIVGGALPSAAIPTTFPNAQLPSLFVLQAPSATLPPGLRMSVFASKRGTNAWVNNIPILQADISLANGVVHKIAAVLIPPSQFLWDRINTDANLTYLKAAVQRADSGVAAASTLQAALSNPAANLTVNAPTNAAMQAFLTGSITQALIAQGLPATTAQTAATALVTNYGTTILTNPASIPDAPIFPPGTNIGIALASALSPTNVKGVAVYHLLGSRAFSVNFPTTATNVPTLLNTAIPTHPGVTLQATFGTTGVTAATVKGVANTTASNIAINPTPAPAGTSDQHYINGVLHIIDQALRPQ